MLSLVIIIFLALLIFGAAILFGRKHQSENNGSRSLSIQAMAWKLLLPIKRFPVGILLLIGLAVLFFLAIHKRFDDIPLPFWAFFSVGTILVILVTLFAEDYWSYVKCYGISIATILLWGIYCYFLPGKTEELPTGKTIQIFVIGGAAFLSILFISFLRKNRDRSFWNFSSKSIFQFALACIFGVVLFGGLSLAMKALDSLFNINIKDKLYADLAVACFLLFTPVYFLSGIPSKEEKHNSELVYTKVGKILALYILTPILAVYTAILYAYLLKIMMGWELPNGWVSWLVSALGAGGLVVITLLYPIRETEDHKIVKFITHRFGLLILPLLVLMTIGIGRRINDYGITINRGYILLLNLWFYGIYTYLFLSRSRHVKWILISIVIVGLLSSVGIWSVANVTSVSLTKEVRETLNKPVTSESARNIFAEMPAGKKERMRSALEYLAKNYGMKSIQPFFVDSVPGDYWTFLQEMNLEDVLIEKMNDLSYHSNEAGSLRIAGYNNFVQIDYFQYNPGKKITYTVRKDGIEISADRRNFSIPVRTSAKDRLLKEKKKEGDEPWIIKGEDYLLSIRQFSGNYFPEKDSIHIISLSGSLFYK